MPSKTTIPSPAQPVGTTGSTRIIDSAQPVGTTGSTRITDSTASVVATAPASSAKPSSGRLPVKTFRLGRIHASIWENEAEKGKFLSVRFSRTYVDEAKQFRDSDSFSRDDLPVVAKLADLAHTFIFERAAEARASGAGFGSAAG